MGLSSAPLLRASCPNPAGTCRLPRLGEAGPPAPCRAAAEPRPLCTPADASEGPGGRWQHLVTEQPSTGLHRARAGPPGSPSVSPRVPHGCRGTGGCSGVPGWAWWGGAARESWGSVLEPQNPPRPRDPQHPPGNRVQPHPAVPQFSQSRRPVGWAPPGSPARVRGPAGGSLPMAPSSPPSSSSSSQLPVAICIPFPCEWSRSS